MTVYYLVCILYSDVCNAECGLQLWNNVNTSLLNWFSSLHERKRRKSRKRSRRRRRRSRRKSRRRRNRMKRRRSRRRRIEPALQSDCPNQSANGFRKGENNFCLVLSDPVRLACLFCLRKLFVQIDNRIRPWYLELEIGKNNKNHCSYLAQESASLFGGCRRIIAFGWCATDDRNRRNELWSTADQRNREKPSKE